MCGATRISKEVYERRENEIAEDVGESRGTSAGKGLAK